LKYIDEVASKLAKNAVILPWRPGEIKGAEQLPRYCEPLSREKLKSFCDSQF
jgi:hypothetical protein